MEIRHWVLSLIIFSVNFCYLFFLGNAFMYACKFWLNMNFENCVLQCMKFVWIWTFDLFLFWKMHVRMHENFVLMKFLIELGHVCLNTWNLILCYFLNDAFMNAWSFWWNLNFWFEWRCMFECIKFKSLFFSKSAFMNA